jgi:hypothetical protein
MSSFKKLSKSDVTVVPNHANKQWLLDYCPYPTSSEYLTIYKGTNVTGSFSLDEDPVTENQYERLVYSQINQLFYQQYTTSLDTSSLMFTLNNYESASQQRPTSSYFIYNDSKNLITSFPTGAMGGIRVLAVNQDIYGNKVLPNHFILSSSAYYVTDDGFGNLYDTKSTKKHIGNIFYAHGLGIITDPDYQLMFPLPPLAKNDIAYFQDTDFPKTISPLNNDNPRGGTLVPSSLVLSGSAADLAFWTNNGDGTVTLNSSVAGTYVIYYTVESSYSCGNIPSNKAKIAVNVSITLVQPTTTSTTTSTTTAPTTTTTSTTTTTTTVPDCRLTGSIVLPTTTTSTTTSTTTAEPTTTTSTTTSTTTAEPTTTTSTTTSTTTAEPTTTTTTTTTTSTTTSTTTVPPTTTTTSTTTSTTTPPPTTTTTTSTTTSTTTAAFDYFLADESTCLYPGCNPSTTGVSVKLPAGTYSLLDWFTTDPISSVVYQLQSVSSFDAGAILLSTGNYSNCNLACVI